MGERRRLWDMGRQTLLAWRQYTDTQRLTQVKGGKRREGTAGEGYKGLSGRMGGNGEESRD
jgi:hypothetical protein